MVLKDVIYSPSLLVNVISTERLKKDNYVGYSNWPNRLFDGGTGETIARTDTSSGLPTVAIDSRVSQNFNQQVLTYYAEIKNHPISIELAHRRLGHIPDEKVRELIKQSTGMVLRTTRMSHPCDECMKGQLKKKAVNKKAPTLLRSIKPLEMIHLDLLTGPVPSLIEGYRYLLVIVDDYTRFAWVFGLKDKSIISNWRKWRSMIEIQYGNKYGDVRNRKYSLRLKFIRADNGGEFISNEIDAIWSSEGISPQLTVAHEHNQAGVVERTI